MTPTSSLDVEILWLKAIKRFGFSKEKLEDNEKIAKRIWDINQSGWEYYLEQHDDSMIHAYRSELNILKMIGNKLLQIETNVFEEKSPIFQEENKSKVKILPFEDENEFYQCAEPWGIKRDNSLQKIEATLIVTERNTRERISDIFILTTRECENLEKFHHDLVEIDNLQWYMDEVFPQTFEISMNTSQKKTIPKTLVTPLLGHKIEWAEITEDTLKEFPHLSDRLKMQGLTQFMEKHPIAIEEALAQLHRKAKDPTHEALTSFFNWLKNSYDLTDRQKYIKLEHAMSQQQFDWKHSPANDLRRALQQAQLSLEEISENKFLESSLRDLLKHRITPAFYMQIYQTPI